MKEINYINSTLTCKCVMFMAERTKKKEKKRRTPKEFLSTNRMFVLEKLDELEIIEHEKSDLLQLFLAMPLDERIRFYFDNFESVFTAMFPDDVGYFAFVPRSEEDWKRLEEDLTRIKA